ncbi:hypothetical protein, partial [Klebsiella pneumoniae]|uniref:hypothetical protein n=1 Tax=Klebsiella pneumoniae TaxID=573 RepID=UPI0013D1D2A4
IDLSSIALAMGSGTNILSLNFRVLSGGHLAKDALVRLNTIASNPLNKDIMKVLGCTAVLLE